MTTTKRKYRPGTHNGPPICIHGKSTKTDDCRECWEHRGWKDLTQEDIQGQIARHAAAHESVADDSSLCRGERQDSDAGGDPGTCLSSGEEK